MSRQASRRGNAVRRGILGLSGAMMLALPTIANGQIEAVRGRNYQLTKQHGPWMIMVASFKRPQKERLSTKGMTPLEAAEELVYELRKVGIPAYTWTQREQLDEVKITDRQGRDRSMSYRSQQESYCVLAGNYASADDKTKPGKIAHATLEYIEYKFQPEFLTKPDHDFVQSQQTSNSQVRKLASGGILRMTPGKSRDNKGPLAGAFLTLNPLLSPEEIQSRKFDPLLVKLNSDADISLLNNTGKYTLVVASFFGRSSKAQVGNANAEAFNSALQSFKPGNSLEVAGANAWELASALRKGFFVIPNGPGGNVTKQAFEAWVFHDRFHSVVTVGSFDRPDDPAIDKLRATFRAKYRENADNKKPFLAAEQLTIPAVVPQGQYPKARWIFDPNPQLVEVPRLGQ